MKEKRVHRSRVEIELFFIACSIFSGTKRSPNKLKMLI
jgi:hypothetical protein